MNFTSRNKILITFLILGLFLFMRLYRLPQTLEFYSDIGRDMYALLTWRQTGKPPLLGPSISFLPLNQSPWYFYLMYPVFFLSGSSPYSSIVTLLLLYSGVFLLGAWVYRKNHQALSMLWTVFGILSIHSLFVEQNRYPWNPSFVTPFVLIAVFSLLFPEGGEKKRTIAFGIGIAFSLAMSYSVLPTLVVLVIAATIRFRKNILWLVGATAIAGLVAFAPLIAFEVSHHFFFYHRLLTEKGDGISLHQDFFQKLKDMGMFLFWGRKYDPKMILLPIVIGIVAYWQTKTDQSKKIFLLFVGSLVLTILAPFTLFSHYVYGVLTILICLAATFPKKYLVLFAIALLPYWFSHDSMQSTLYRPIRRSINDLSACAKIVCDEEKDPIYVTETAWHEYHYAPDHLFFLNKAGCKAKDITNNPGFAKRMAVVIDQGSYTYGKTSFNELTLFEPSEYVHYYACNANMAVVMLEKIE